MDMALQIRWDMPVPSQVLRDASEVRYYTALGWQHVNTMFSNQISWKKLSRKVLYTARRAREESSNEVLRKRFAELKTAKDKTRARQFS